MWMLLLIIVPGIIIWLARGIDKIDYKSGKQNKKYGTYVGQKFLKEGEHEKNAVSIIFILSILIFAIIALIDLF